jgi:hypothetical protein
VPIYLYGLILSRNASRVPANVAGIDGSAVRAVQCDQLGAIVSTIDAVPSRENRDAIVRHDVALTKLARAAITALSSRFGQTFADDSTLCAELATFSSRFLAVLERYDGYGEMRIHARDVIAPPEPMRASMEPPQPPGRAYLESIREKTKPRPIVDFRALLGDLVLDERTERRTDIQTISHLVRFADEPRYRVALHTHPALEGATITGPHALHTFAEPA